MKPTIYTIAQAAGVSIATVSRAFNGSTRVSEHTRERVLALARELGYQPSASARSLARQSTETLALVFPQVSGPYFSEFIRGAESVTRASQYHLLVYSSPDAGDEDPFLRLLPARTDGIILGTRASRDSFFRQLHAQGFPFLVLGRALPGLETSSVRPDNEEGAYHLTRHLLTVHHLDRVAFISGPEDQLHSRERRAGVERALAESGLALPAGWVETGAFDEASGYAAAARLLDLDPLPQAIVAGNDQMAIGAIAAANQRGLRVPEDVAVAGFDDIPPAPFMRPALTTVNLGIFEQGEQAVGLLLERILDPAQPVKVVTIPAELKIRRSCGCGEG